MRPVTLVRLVVSGALLLSGCDRLDGAKDEPSAAAKPETPPSKGGTDARAPAAGQIEETAKDALGAAAPEEPSVAELPPPPVDEPPPDSPTAENPDQEVPSDASDVATPSVAASVAERLAINLADATVVSTTQELLDHVASDATLIVNAGKYVLPETGLAIPSGTSNLAILGASGATPELVVTKGTGPTLDARDVQNLTLHNLAIAGGTRSTKDARGAGGVSITKGHGVRLDAVSIKGNECLHVSDTSDFVLSGGEVSGCADTIANLERVRSAKIERTLFGRSRVRNGFVLDGTNLLVKEATFRGNIGLAKKDEPSSLFFFASETSPAAADPASATPSSVTVESATLLLNRFTRLTNDSDRVAVDERVRVPTDQFEDPSHDGQSAWSCLCSWTRTATGYQPQTRCLPTNTACQTLHDRIEAGKESQSLPSGVRRGCSTRHVKDLPESMGGADGWSRKGNAFVFDGKCLPSTAAGTLVKTAAPTICTDTPSADCRSTAPVRWDALAPIQNAGTTKSRVWVRFPVDDDAIAKRVEEYASDKKYRRGSKQIPSAIAEMKPPTFVSAKGPSTPNPDYNSVELIGTLYDGAWWKVNYHRGKAGGPAIALGGTPHPDAKFRPARAMVPRGKKHRLVRLFERHAKFASRSMHSHAMETCHAQSATGRFPGGATEVAAVRCEDYETATTAIFTATSDGTVVQVFQVVVDDWSEIQAVGDLDGDGYDEILWFEQAIESSSENLIRMTETSIERIKLFASGH